MLLYLRYGLAQINIHDGGNGGNERNIDDIGIKEYAMKIYELLRGNEKYIGKNPRILAASILYIAVTQYCLDYTQEKIAKILNVSGQGIRQVYQFIKKTENI